MNRQDFIVKLSEEMKDDDLSEFNYSIFVNIDDRDPVDENYENFPNTANSFIEKINNALAKIGISNLSIPNDEIEKFIDWSNYKYTIDSKGNALAFISLNELYDIIKDQLPVNYKSKRIFRLESGDGKGIFDTAYEKVFEKMCRELILHYHSIKDPDNATKIEEILNDPCCNYKAYFSKIEMVAKANSIEYSEGYEFLFDYKKRMALPDEDDAISSVFNSEFGYNDSTNWKFAFKSKKDLFKFIKEQNISDHLKSIDAKIICIDISDEYYIESDSQAAYLESKSRIVFEAKLINNKKGKENEKRYSCLQP